MAGEEQSSLKEGRAYPVHPWCFDAGFELVMLMECDSFSQGLSAQGIGVSLLFPALFSISKFTLLLAA